MNKSTTIGIDLAKTVFFVVVLDQRGKQARRKKLRRSELLPFLANYPEAMIAMEACSGAHYWAREMESLGHVVELLPAQHIKGYLRGQKNDYNDAEAIAEAAQHGRIRTVAVKSVEQQLDQSLHRLRQALVALLEDAENGLPWRLRELLGRQYQLFLGLEDELAWYEREIKKQAAENETCQRLMSIPGYGPIVSSAFYGWMGSGQQFRSGRDVAAALGLVPKQYSTGGRAVLGGISKRGDKHLRALLVHGARAVARYAKRHDDRLSRWVCNLIERRGYNKAVVALANKLARIGWAVVTKEQAYAAIPA